MIQQSFNEIDTISRLHNSYFELLESYTFH